MKSLKLHLYYIAMGTIMGFVLAHIGFGDFGQVHRMFLFKDLRLLFVFGGAVVTALVAFAIIQQKTAIPHKILHKGTVPGSILFGIGWALTGACPSVALVQLGLGRAPAIFTIFGILFGTWMYRHLHARYFRWDRGACE
ncbi:MAG: DUF6691 family protein [Acidiferrobacteraceae bacterium]